MPATTWRNRAVSDVMRPYIEQVLHRDGIPYSVNGRDGQDRWLFSLPLKGKEFTVVLEDALCEKQRASTISQLPVYSLRTFHDAEKFKRLAGINGTSAFHILDCDMPEFCRLYGIPMPADYN